MNVLAVVAVVVRFAILAGTMVLVGALVAEVAVLPRALRPSIPTEEVVVAGNRAIRRLCVLVAAALVPIIALRLLLEVHEFAEDLGWLAAGRGVLTGMKWGKGWCVQFIGAGAVLLGRLLAHDESREPVARPGPRAGSVVAVLGVLALTIAPALTGHAIASPSVPGLAVVADWLHVVGAGAWLGTLFVLLVVCLPATTSMSSPDRARATVGLVRAFSPFALAGAGMILLTGIISSWLHLNAVDALWRDPYGRLVGVKICLFAVIAAFGAYNWRRVTPGVEAGDVGIDGLERSATAELGVTVVLLVVTAILVATAPPMEG